MTTLLSSTSKLRMKLTIARERVFTRSDFLTFVMLTGASWTAIVYFLASWFSFNDMVTHTFSFSLLTIIALVRIANSQIRWVTLPFMKRPLPVAPVSGLRVAVVTSIVPQAESLKMLEESVRAMVALDYPHDTWVLDEGDDDEVKDLCQRLGAIHFSRKNLPQYQAEEGIFKMRSKHGNYNAWFHEIGFAEYEFITAFDPDHVPVPAFLSSVLGYFRDPSVGYVQAAQVYYNQQASFIARGAAEETYDYYSCTQMAADNLGHPAMVGCHNTHRVAVLKSLGGLAPHDADDLLTGMLYQTNGWQGVYLPRILAKGLTPVDWNGYLVQQLRWARSVIDVKFRFRRPAVLNLPPQGWALSTLHGLFYVQNSITTFFSLLLLAYLLAIGSAPAALRASIVPGFALLVGTLQMCAFYRQKFYLDPRNEWGIHWRAQLLRYAKWPVFLLGFWDVVFDRQVPYALTGKAKAKASSHLLTIPHTAVIILICAACITGRILKHEVSLLLYCLAAITVLTSLLLILTSRINFPPPYE